MKNLRIQISKILLSLSGVILWIAVLALIYCKSQDDLYTQIANVWKQTTTTDCQTRFIKADMKYTSKTSLDKDSLSLIIMETEKEKVEFNRKEIVTPQSEEERELRKSQTILFQENPIQVIRLDSLFRANLHDIGLSIQSAVSYSYKDTSKNQLHQFSCSIDTLFLSGNGLTAYKVETAIDNSIILYGYTKLSCIDYIRNEKILFLLWLSCGLVFVLIIGIYSKRPVLTSMPNDNKHLQSEEQPLLNTVAKEATETLHTKISYHHFERTLICKDISVSFTPLQGDLFYILLTSENYQSDYEHIIKTLWPKVEGEKKNLEKLRKGLKEKLESFPIHIQIVRGSGYRLEIDEPYTIAEE